MTYSDEQICAYLDGLMDQDEAASFEAALANDEELQMALDRLSKNDAALREAFEMPMHEAVDDTMLQRFGLNVQPITNAAAPKRSEAANDNPSFWSRRSFAAGGAIAAALAIFLVSQNMRSSQTELFKALESTPSGVIAQLGDGQKLTPKLTFTSSDGRFCREYESSQAQVRETSIACRESGDWRIQATVKTAPTGPSSSENGYAVASGDDGAALTRAYDQLGASDPLTAEAERALVTSGWQKN